MARMRTGWCERVFLILILLISCTHGRKMHFDADSWKKDPNGCLGMRMSIYPALMEHRKDLLALDNEKIIKILGAPAINELYKRNQKFFVYPITTSGTACTAGSKDMTEELYLIIRFNATGLANEIFINNNRSPFR